MKVSLLGVIAVMACIGTAGAAGNRSSMYSSIDMRNSEGDTIRINRGMSESYSGEHRGYARHNARRSGMYDNVETGYQRAEPAEPVSKQTYVKGDTYKKTAMRKYFIANPFYQPLKGQFGSVTTGEYLEGKYNIDGNDVHRKLKELSIKEDLSYGLTDRIALQGMAKYNYDKLVWSFDDGTDAKYKKRDLNVYGLGIQGRIIDTNEWISTLSGYYEHQKHGIDYFIADFKAGYKVASSTIYGLLRGWAVNMDGDLYGDYIESQGGWGLLVYNDSEDTIYMGEAGLGVWTVLAEDWTLNIEGLYGAYDWHNQLSIKGAFGWQPNDYFALNLYAKTSLYDSADGKHLHSFMGTLPLDASSWQYAVENDHYYVELSKVKEWSVGLQVMFQF